MYIENINGPADVKKLNIAQMTVLASEIRDALLTKLSRHGGHFGPNFGMVEATIALHYVFESPKDKFVFDVSHQSYPHKMLTRFSLRGALRRRFRLQQPARERARPFHHRSHLHLGQSGLRSGQGPRPQGRGRQRGCYHR